VRFQLLVLCLWSLSSGAGEIQTNSIHMADAPGWVARPRVEKILDHIQMLLEWDIRKIEVYWYKDQASFERAHSLGSSVMAVSRKSDNTVHLGPKVSSANFDQTLGHELVHIISYQKYKDAIPRWLEEGLANHLAKAGKVDYPWLASKPFPHDVRELVHPVSGSVDNIRYNYMASQALIEMIAHKCDLANLLRLSVGMKMESYLDTYCEIPDINAAFKKWVKAHFLPPKAA
jgi:hypothetical protein